MYTFFAKHKKMDTFFDENPEFDNSGTNEDPLLLGWIRGKNNAKGRKLVHKILESYYCGMVHTTNKDGTKTLRCQDYRDGCCWKRIVKPISGEHDVPEFYGRDNWSFRPRKRIQEVHTCGGVDKKHLNDLQYRNYVRKEVEENRQINYKQIKKSSGIEEKFSQIYFEICFKFGFINDPNVNSEFERLYPNYRNTIII